MFTILQIQPEITLLGGLAIIGLFVWFLWPKNGGLALISKFSKNNRRVALEDALKFIFDCEYNKVICNVSSIAAHLNLSLDKAGHLMNRLSAMELVLVQKSGKLC